MNPRGRPRVWTDERALEALRSLAREIGRTPSCRDMRRSTGTCPTETFYRLRFGSVRAAVIRAGLPVRGRGGQILRVHRIDPDKAREITERIKAHWGFARSA